MEEGIIWLIIILAIVLIALPFILRNVLPAIYWAVAILSVGIFWALDQIFSAGLLPHCPWVMWTFWGALIGGALAFWTVAPNYGLREQRRWILLTPVGLMAVIALLRAMFT